MTKVDERILEAARKVTAKRARTVIDHIIAHGSITTEQLKDDYGYNHPPRAVRDVREQGIPIETFKVTGRDGRKIAAYRFGNPSDVERHKLGGRKTFSKKFKNALVEKYGSRGAITNEIYQPRYLQIDHRIPYEVIGDNVSNEDDLDAFMLLTGTSQRQKSWSCEHCENLISLKDPEICRRCYWAFPESYTHVATKEERRVDIVWQSEEVEDYERLSERASRSDRSVQSYIKETLKRTLEQEDN